MKVTVLARAGSSTSILLNWLVREIGKRLTSSGKQTGDVKQ